MNIFRPDEFFRAEPAREQNNSKINRVLTLVNWIWLALILAFAVQLCSCGSSKKLAYMQNLADTSAGSLAKALYSFESPIQKNDQLWITVGGTNLEDLASLNSGSGIIPGNNIGSNTPNTTSPAIGYLVEADGTVKLPYLDKVKAEGLTRTELERILTEKYKEYTKNPVINVRYLNYKVTVLGAVAHPGSFVFPNERMTVLEALGLAGDLTVLGKRENVLVIREINGAREFGRLNLLSKDIFQSPYYYLKTNDVVYVEPSPASSVTRERFPQYIGLIAGVLSLLITVIYTTKN